MKKVFDQTVRDLKREVNKKVLKVPRIEMKILDATNNEPWGPHGSHLADIAEATQHYREYQLIMSILWKRIGDTGKNWRHVYKGLTVLEYLVAHGSERVVDDIKEHVYQISALSNFRYIDSKGTDQGNNVRRKSQTLVALVNDKDRVHEVRKKAAINKDKFRSNISRYDAYGPVHGDQYDDDRYKDDGYRGRFGEEYKSGSQSKGRELSPGQDENHSSRPIENESSEPHVVAPPSYEEATKAAPKSIQNEMIETSVKPDSRSPSLPETKSTFEAANASHFPQDTAPVYDSNSLASDDFDPRNSLASPRVENNLFGSVPAEDSINALALVPVTFFSTQSEPDIPPTLGWESFDSPSSASSIHKQAVEDPFGDPFRAAPQRGFTTQMQTNSFEFHPPTITPKSQNITGLDLGESLHGPTYTPQSAGSGQPTLTPGFPPPATPTSQVLEGLFPGTTPSSASPLQATPIVALARVQSAPPDFVAQSSLAAPVASTAASLNYHEKTGWQFHVASMNQPLSLAPTASPPPPHFAPQGSTPQSTPLNLLGQPLTSQSLGSTKPLQPEEKFETKSTIWSDTINRGLINLDISGSKTNPLAGIGVDFDSINRKEQREKVKRSTSTVSSTNFVSTVSMGKAMVSGIGRASATSLDASTNPMMNSGMGVGIRGAMNTGIGQGMVMQPGWLPGHSQMGMGAMGGHDSQQYGWYR